MKNINQKQKILKNKITKQGFANRALKTKYQIRNKQKKKKKSIFFFSMESSHRISLNEEISMKGKVRKTRIKRSKNDNPKLCVCMYIWMDV